MVRTQDSSTILFIPSRKTGDRNISLNQALLCPRAWVLGVLLLPPAVSAVRAAAQTSAAARPDLDVAYLSLEPRYPAYDTVITEGVPLLLDAATREPLPPNGKDPVRRWPKKGEQLIATGRVVNHGTAPTGPFRYVWLVDGKKVATGQHAGLAPDCAAEADTTEWRLAGAKLRQARLRPGTYVDFSHPFSWKKGQRIELRLEPAGVGPEELSVANNSREERTDALAFVVLVRRSAYNRWAQLATPDAPRSFEDWMQLQFSALYQKLERSAYASAPGGVRQPLRIDLIRVLDDAEPAASFDEVSAANGWDGYVDSAGSPDPATQIGRVDWELLRGVARQLGLVDLAALRVLPEANAVKDASGQLAAIGYQPASAFGYEDGLLPEHSVRALNRLEGTRRGYPGIYLYDVPRACRLRVLDNNGRAVPDTELSVFEARAGAIEDHPVAEGKTDTNGEWTLPNRPAPPVRTPNGFELTANPFGKIDLNGGNGLLLVRIAARGETEYQWLPITTFNSAFWRGQTALATFDLRTRLPMPQSPAAPTQVKGPPSGIAVEQVPLSWTPSADQKVVAYFIYRGRYPGYDWERVGSVPAQRPRYSDEAAPPLGGSVRLRYAVSAVDLQGNESGLARLPNDVVVYSSDE